MQPASPEVQSPSRQPVLQLSTADNARGIAAHPGTDVAATAQLQKADPAALQPALVSRLQSPGSASLLQSSASVAQLQDSGDTAQLQLSVGTTQLQQLASTPFSGYTAPLQQKVHPAEVQISAVAQKEPLQRRAEESLAEPMLSQQADEGDPTYRPAADEHAPRHIAGFIWLGCTAASSMDLTACPCGNVTGTCIKWST